MTSRPCLALLLVGCAAAPTAPPQPPASPPAPIAVAAPVAVPASAPASAPASVPDPAPPAPAPAVAPVPAPAPPPAPTTCEITQSSWDHPAGVPLRTPTGRPYLTIRRADEVTVRTAGGVVVEYSAHGLRLRSAPRTGDLPLYPTAELDFAGVLQAGLATALNWAPADGPRLRVSPRTDRRVRFLADPAVELACADLGLTHGFSELPATDHHLRARPSIAVATSPGGPAVLHLHLARAVPVKLLARSGAHAQIAWPIADGPLADATVRGWVDARLVVLKDNFLLGDPHGFGGLGLRGTSHWGGCAGEHPLHVDAGRGPEPIGTILAGTRVLKGRRRGAFVEVVVEGQATQSVPVPFTLRPGARFLLAPAAADECARGS